MDGKRVREGWAGRRESDRGMERWDGKREREIYR